MRWAENRNTKKKEDKAYCLLGIFNVFIPLIYGEGENAFIRLREAIDNSPSGKHSACTQFFLADLRTRRIVLTAQGATPCKSESWKPVYVFKQHPTTSERDLRLDFE